MHAYNGKKVFQIYQIKNFRTQQTLSNDILKSKIDLWLIGYWNLTYNWLQYPKADWIRLKTMKFYEPRTGI